MNENFTRLSQLNWDPHNQVTWHYFVKVSFFFIIKIIKKKITCNGFWVLIKRGNCTLLTYGLAHFNSAHPWFKSCHLTHLRWLPLDPRYPHLPFPLENPLYYISQNLNRIRILKKTSSLPLSTLKPPKIPKPIIPFSLYFDCYFFVFSGRLGEFGTKPLSLPWRQVVVVIV